MEDEDFYKSPLDMLYDLVQEYPFSAMLYVLRTQEPEEVKKILRMAVQEIKKHP